MTLEYTADTAITHGIMSYANWILTKDGIEEYKKYLQIKWVTKDNYDVLWNEYQKLLKQNDK